MVLVALVFFVLGMSGETGAAREASTPVQALENLSSEIGQEGPDAVGQGPVSPISKLRFSKACAGVLGDTL